MCGNGASYMDNEKQTYISYMKLLWQFIVGICTSSLDHMWESLRYYFLRLEVLFLVIMILILILYWLVRDVWSKKRLTPIHTLDYYLQQADQLRMTFPVGHQRCWAVKQGQSAAYAVLGRRPQMEDRFVIEENINSHTGVSFFAIFDGHGGQFAADYAKDILVQNIYNKIVEATELLESHPNRTPSRRDGTQTPSENKETKKNEPAAASVERNDSIKKSYSTKDGSSAKSSNAEKQTDVFPSKLNSLIPPLAEDNLLNVINNMSNTSNIKVPPTFDAKYYIENGNINFGKIITDEILSADYKLVEAAKRTRNLAGTTALIAIIQGSKLIVANVGDSRGVMCDFKGEMIPLSVDHKPEDDCERKRIEDAGGFVELRGVWRVNGVLATSRALGDYPLKDRNVVIAEPDILTFELKDHLPKFLLLASDGLWDTFTKEEAVVFVKNHLSDPLYGAGTLAMESYHRGSTDNITIIIVVFKDGMCWIASANGKGSSRN